VGLAEFTVAGHVDAGADLLGYHLGDGIGQLGVERLLVIAGACLLGGQGLPDGLGLHQAADVGGHDAVGAR